jgi:hypothetical protein
MLRLMVSLTYNTAGLQQSVRKPSATRATMRNARVCAYVFGAPTLVRFAQSKQRITSPWIPVR